MWTNEIKTKTKPSHVTFKLTTGSIIRFSPQPCNGFIKGWLHCLTLVSKRRFLVNNILMFGSAWCLVRVQIQFSLIKKIKIGCRERSLTPHPLLSITSHPLYSKSKQWTKWISWKKWLDLAWAAWQQPKRWHLFARYWCKYVV